MSDSVTTEQVLAAVGKRWPTAEYIKLRKTPDDLWELSVAEKQTTREQMDAMRSKYGGLPAIDDTTWACRERTLASILHQLLELPEDFTYSHSRVLP